MTAAEQRIADLERQLEQLRRDFEANWTMARFLHEIGYEHGRASVLGQRPSGSAGPRPRGHLRPVSEVDGGAR